MKLREDLEVIIEKQPYYESLNQKLLQDVESVDYSHWSYKTNVKAKMSDFQTHSKSIELVTEWIASLIDKEYQYVQRGYRLDFENTWFAKYDHGDYTKEHDHALCFFSFVYYIKCPPGSAPLVFTTTGKQVNPEEGMVVIFRSCMRHGVPQNGCDNRIVLAGNVELTKKIY